MSVDFEDVLLRLRESAGDIVVATTGSMSLEATGSTYVRTTGSFITDGFRPGMEITEVVGFVDTAPSVVKEVSALVLTVDRALTTAAAAGGRSLTVGLPSRVSDENVEFEPTAKKPFYVEQLIPGPPITQLSMGGRDDNATLMVEPMYQLQIHVEEGVGSGALYRYVSAIVEHFRPNTTIALSNGDVIRVREDRGPYPANQILRSKPGFATLPVAIPLRLFTLNN